jgi:hypothetical protein
MNSTPICWKHYEHMPLLWSFRARAARVAISMALLAELFGIVRRQLLWLCRPREASWTAAFPRRCRLMLRCGWQVSSFSISRIDSVLDETRMSRNKPFS